MTPSDRSTEEILDELIDLDPALRPVRLVELCDHDAAMMEEVRSLLRAFEASGDFLETPAALVGVDEEEPLVVRSLDLAGQQFGPYRIVRHLGSGGSGDVHLAEREIEGYRQRVALKIIRTALLAPEALHRFRNECRVLARLDHPAIARLVEGAVTPDGVPYLAIEYVDGLPIDRHADERGLGVAARVRLLVEACEAVAHLHRHSVLHRDVKPANLLVTDDGRVKLIDMGIARVMEIADDDQLTVTGWERMTPAYASPEQLRGEDLTTASDVYALGVLGFRLLTGRLPYLGKSRGELEREMTTTTVPRPSEVARTMDADMARHVAGDLDSILLKALHRDVERRYPSADALRADLERYLDGRPVEARGDSFAYLAGTFVRRNRAAVSAAGLLLLVLVASTFTGFALYGRAETARREAERERATAEQTVRFLDGILAAADPLGVSAEVDLTVRDALERAARRIEIELADQPLVAARLEHTIGQAFANLGALDEGEVHLARAARLYEENGEAQAEDALLNAQRRVELHWKQGEIDVADSLLAPLLRTPPPTAALRVNLGLVASRVRGAQAAYPAADSLARIAVRDAEGLLDPGVGLPAQAANQLGVVLYQTGRYAEADSVFTLAAALAERDLGPAHMLTGEFIGNRGTVLGEMGRVSEAIELNERAQEIQGALLPADHVDLGVGETNLGNLHLKNGDAEAAAGHFERAAAIFAASVGTEHNYWGFAVNGLGVCYERLGRAAEADSLWARAHTVMLAQLGPDHPQPALVLTNRAKLRNKMGDAASGRELGLAALAALRRAFPDGHHLVSRAEVAVARSELDLGRPREALAHAERATSACAELAVTHTDRIDATITRIRCLAAIGPRETAVAELDTLIGDLVDGGVSESLLERVREVRVELLAEE